MKKTQYKPIHNRKDKLNKRGEALVQIEVYYQRRRKYISTGIYLKPEQWDGNQVVNHENAEKLNKRIWENIIALELFELEQKDFTLKNINEYLKGEQIDDFYLFYKHEMEANNRNKLPTYQQHNSTLKHLLKYGRIISFTDLTFDRIQGFDYYLRSLDLHQNTIRKHHKNLRVYINLAIKKGKVDRGRDPYNTFKTKRLPTERVFLTSAELTAIEEMIFPDEFFTLEKVRDLFLFSCYTGVRFSDLQRLTTDQLGVGANGYVMDIRMHKTGKPVNIPLGLLFGGKPERIVLKYQEAGNKKLFPGITNQHFNRELKVIALKAGISKRLTHHVARHTFATQLLSKSKNIYLVKELLGHSRVQITEIYSHLINEVRDDELRAISW